MNQTLVLLVLLVAAVLTARPLFAQQQTGSIRGLVLDADFDLPLEGAQVLVVETSQSAKTNDQGNYLIGEIKPGRYTVIVSRSGFTREVRTGIVVNAGQLTDLNVNLAGEYVDLEEFIVAQAIQLGGSSEQGLLNLRIETPALLDSIGSELMSRAGASDAASALRLVAGASIQNGKSAVIRGLPDRYVSSQINGVRLPSADDEKRAVELDQFPSTVIESISVSKTFTPDQQGDASGGAVNLVLKGIPKDPYFIQFKSQIGFNTQVGVRHDFLNYDGGGLNFLGDDDGGRDQQLDRLGMPWLGAVGVAEEDAPIEHKWSLAGGASYEFDSGIRIGGFTSLFYERDSSFSNDGIDDNLWVTDPGEPLTPQGFQGPIEGNDFKTGLFDVTEASKEVQWGVLSAFGIEWEKQSINFTYLYTRTVEDSVTYAEDTRGKAYFFPGYDPYDPTTPGHDFSDAAPYLRLQTLEYTERSTATFQIHGEHEIPTDYWGIEGLVVFKQPTLDWTVAFSSADSYQPDKRQFGSFWIPEKEFFPGFSIPATFYPFKPAANFTLGNLQRIWKEIEEESDQYQANLKLPFDQWDGHEGYFKFGFFSDHVERVYDQDSFSNFNDAAAIYEGDFRDRWSDVFPFETDPSSHPITESLFDVDYDGEQDIEAFYMMLDLPLTENLKVIGGVRFESTKISIINDPEASATWFPAGSISQTTLNPGDGDVAFEQDDVLPSITLEYKPIETVTLRAAYSNTVARQTFRELSPILQQEFLGGPIFIGNPDLQMSSVTNYDFRADWNPYQGGLVSFSWFYKDIEDPIEYVQRIRDFNFTTAVNYPKGRIKGYEFEVRQDLGRLFDDLEGLSIGANLTLIDSRVNLPDDEVEAFNAPNLLTPMSSRDMTNAPEYLANIYMTYDVPEWGTQLGLFYTIQGDTLLAGAGESKGNFVPSIYQKSYGTLNFSLSQKIGDHVKLQFQAKNLLDPMIERVYRSEYIGKDVTETSSTKGIDFSLSLSAEFRF